MPDNLPYPCLIFSVNSPTIFEDNPEGPFHPRIPSTIYQLLFHLAYNRCVQSLQGFLRTTSVSDGFRQWLDF